MPIGYDSHGYASRQKQTYEEMFERGRQLAIEQGIDPDALRPTDPDEVGAEFLREHSPSLLMLGDEMVLTWTWGQDPDELPTEGEDDVPSL